jgi:hypothetical protein
LKESPPAAKSKKNIKAGFLRVITAIPPVLFLLDNYTFAGQQMYRINNNVILSRQARLDFEMACMPKDKLLGGACAAILSIGNPLS